MNELKELLTQIRDLRTYRIESTYANTAQHGWDRALETLEDWVNHKLNSMIRKSPV